MKPNIAVFLIFMLLSGCAPAAPARLAPTPALTPAPASATFTPGPGLLIGVPRDGAEVDPTNNLPVDAPKVDAIDALRAALELPDLPLEFVESTRMANSPSGGLMVAVYQDTAGRKYSFSPEYNQVVEIDARALLAGVPPDAPGESPDALKTRALAYFKATIPDLETRKSAWQYEEGGKGGENYFFNYYAPIPQGAMNRPFAQIAMHKSGLLFAYYNTLMIDQ